MAIDLFTDSDAILNFCPIDFCLKWTLYFVSTSNFMKEYQFSGVFAFRKLFNMSLKVYIFMNALTMNILIYPVASENFTTLDKILVPAFLWKFL